MRSESSHWFCILYMEIDEIEFGGLIQYPPKQKEVGSIISGASSAKLPTTKTTAIRIWDDWESLLGNTLEVKEGFWVNTVKF